MTEVVPQSPVVQISELEELGFKAAADGVKAKRELARKMRIAFEHFRVVTPENITQFNKQLMEETRSGTMYGGYIYKTLAFTPIEQYSEVPPVEALAKLKEAKKLDCFDTYVVATIESVKKVPDPILFGCITGCDNKYFIAQWDDDVKIEDILKDDEG